VGIFTVTHASSRTSSTFIPISIDVVGARSVVRWIERPDAPSTMPSFARMTRELLDSGARQRVTPIDALFTAEGRDPVGLVAHLSRCGSTLLMQSLAHGGCIAPVSEAVPVNQLLARSDISEHERAGLLRGVIRALTPRDDASSALPLLVKLTSWNVLFFDVIRAAFPDTPWLFLYREPLEALASHLARPATWLADDGFLAALTHLHRLPSVAGLPREQRCAAVLAAYGEAALRASPTASNLLNYNQLPGALSTDVPARFGVATSAAQRERIADASHIYSKDVTRRLVFDPAAERRARPVSDAMREADRQYTRPVYAALELRRIDASRGA
jgi:hypothetical protein